MASFPLATRRWAQEMKRQIGYSAYIRKNPALLNDLESRLKEAVERATTQPFAFIDLLSMRDGIITHFERAQTDSDIFADKELIARTMYDQLRHRYSFIEALGRGVYAPWPHELTSVTCASQALVNFVVAQECCLDPEIMEFGSFKERNAGHYLGGHTIVTVNAGEENRWVIDQSYGMLGPITFDRNSFTVQNIGKGHGAEEKECRTKEYEFDYCDSYGEEEYAERMEHQRSREGAASMLLNGQRLGFPETDRWKSVSPLRTSWYLRFEENTRTITSLVGICRLLIQNRGVECAITVDEQGRIEKELVKGYFCDIGWAAFVEAIPLVEIPKQEVPELIEGLESLSVEQQTEFESYLMGLFRNDEQADAGEQADGQADERGRRYADAAQASYDRLQGTQYGDAVRKLALVEALYQQKKGDDDYVYNERVRKIRMQGMKNEDVNIDDLLKAKKRLAKARKGQERIKRGASRLVRQGRSVCILPPERLEDERVREYLSIDSPVEKLANMLKNTPKFFDEAIDRVLFVREEVVHHAATLESLETYGRTVFGSQLDQAVRIGYARIFAEFLGHFANSWEQLQLSCYREDIIKKVVAYRKP